MLCMDIEVCMDMDDEDSGGGGVCGGGSTIGFGCMRTSLMTLISS